MGTAMQTRAVTQMGSDSYSYDNNGNQVTRNVSGSSYTLSYDAENRLTGVSGVERFIDLFTTEITRH